MKEEKFIIADIDKNLFIRKCGDDGFNITTLVSLATTHHDIEFMNTIFNLFDIKEMNEYNFKVYKMKVSYELI